MKESKQIPQLKSYEELAEFWDSHSLDDYWEQTKPAEFEVSEQFHHHYLVPVEKNLLSRIGRLARNHGVSIETFTNLLLEQRIEYIEANQKKRKQP